MAKPEFEQRQSPENGNVRLANPADLMRDNPAALIVNKESYDRMAGNFTYGLKGQFEPPQVVKVKTFSSDHGEVTRDFVLDGMTRTKFVHDNAHNPKVIPPDFQFTIKDVTEAVLQNPAVISVEERESRQQALTMLQYLRAVIPPTVEHSQIAPDRIAAHLINGWENMVGESLSKKYSALAALSLLANPGINIATDEALRKDLGKQSRLISDETIEERVRLQGALVEMAQIIRQTKLIRQEVARSAFMLVSAESPVIGGEREARKQIYGLLHTPEVERKLAEAFPSVGEREQMKDQLGQFISDSFRKVAKVPNREEVISVLCLALKDSNLNFNYVIDIFTSDNPVKRYDEVREDINREKLANAYLSVLEVPELSLVEEQLIDNLGRKTFLNEQEALGSIRAIKSAEDTLTQAVQFADQIAAKRDELIATGVNLQLLDQVIPRIQTAREGIFAATNLKDISKKTQELNDTVSEIKRRIDTQVSAFKVGDMIDEITEGKLSEGYGPQIRSDIVGLVLGEFGIINPSNQTKVYIRARELASLDSDLLLGIKRGDFRREVALQRQRERIEVAKAKQVKSQASAPTMPIEPKDVSFAPPVRQRATTESSGRVILPATPTSPREPEDVVDIKKLDERRKRTNRENLNLLLDSLNRRLKEIDLIPEDITDEERQRINAIITKLGWLAYGHPNTPNVMQKEYPELQARVKKLQSQATYQKIEDAQKDARTKQ